MNQTLKRLLLYGGAFAILAGLGFAVRNCREEADVNTLLGSVDVQLRLAYGIPAVDKQGKELTSRTQMIVDAERYLDTIERIQPGMAVATEFRGFAHMLRGQFAEAAAAYGRARLCKDCTAEQGDILAFNQARMLARAGQGAQALSVFQSNASALDRRFGGQRSIEEASILRSLNRTGEAEGRIDAVVGATSVEPMAWLQAGREYEQLGRTEKAERAYATVVGTIPIADYHLARLKLQQGDVDKSLELLGRAVAAVPAEVRRLVQEEPEAWRAVQANARFQELTVPRAATPGR
jgi:tetratricopeptide (TPR) repeat protein